MAQAEDTELRDLVIEALEKNGSLAKIRALLRANVFLVFEDECENVKQNGKLDSVLKLPEGALCLSIIHEFLEFCNLKNTLFVYMAESRQKKEYIYEGQHKLLEKLNLPKQENIKEPILVQLLKRMVSHKKYFDRGDIRNPNREKCDNQNCTYIVHEDSNSSAASNSQSDNSSDEKNKLHLRLALDNSDTDTSSDSTRDKSSSEYIPSEHIIIDSNREDHVKSSFLTNASPKENTVTCNMNTTTSSILKELKLISNNSSSDSTSYIDVKPYKPLGDKLSNTKIPILEANEKDVSDPVSVKTPDPKSPVIDQLQQHESRIDPISSETISSSSLRNEEALAELTKPKKIAAEESGKSEAETAEYSNDFSSSPVPKNTNISVEAQLSPEYLSEEIAAKSPRNISENQLLSSQSSQSSISISDVADLISEKSSYGYQDNNSLHANKSSNSKKKVPNDKSKISDDSAEFSESPIPSLSNLSLDIHSD